MNMLSGLFLVAAALLALGGAFKLSRPAPTALALSALRLPGSNVLARVLGVGEVLVAVYALIIGDRMAALLVAAAYLCFAGFVGVALRREVMLGSCGCFGQTETPPSVTHIVINLGAAAVAGAVAVHPTGGVVEVLAEYHASGVAFILLVAVTVYLIYVALTVLPAALRLVGNDRPVVNVAPSSFAVRHRPGGTRGGTT